MYTNDSHQPRDPAANSNSNFLQTYKNTNSVFSANRPPKSDYKKQKKSAINWNIKFSKVEGSWDKIGSGKFNTAQRGDEESRRNRVYKNFIREKGHHKESSKQFRWK